tara:strand:+ start:669 stop:830 length:162 start_codon:yes stop_codon:yes gene_type:complete
MRKSIIYQFRTKGYFIGQLNLKEKREIDNIKNKIFNILKKNVYLKKKKKNRFF